MSLNIEGMFRCLRDFDFATLLVKELHWSPPVSRKIVSIDRKHSRHEIARYAGVPVFEVTAADGVIPDLKTRDTLRQEISPLFRKCLLIFLDEHRTQSVWHWVRRERTSTYRREYVYVKGQPEDLLLNKLSTMVTDIIPLDTKRMSKGAASVQNRPPVSKIYQEFTEQRRQLAKCIEGVDKEGDRDLYASMLLNRQILLYFLQQRGFIEHGNERNLGIDLQNVAIQISNAAFENLFSFFSRKKWQIVDVPSGEREDEEITPEMLGRIFEMHFNQVSGIGLSFTPPEIPEYLCRKTIYQAIWEKVRPQASHSRQDSLASLEEMLAKLDARQCRRLLFEVLPSLTVLDPACGSGAFLVAALNTLITIYSEVIGKIASFNDDVLSRWLNDLHQKHRGVLHNLKKNIIANNLYGVDIREDAIETTRLRLYLSLITSAHSADELEPLSDVVFHLSAGNSLVGLHANEEIEEPVTFDWRHAYPQIIKRQVGFNVIISNPPWEVLKLSSRQTSETDKYQRTIWQLLPHYKYQDGIVHGKVRKAEVHLYKLFLEQSYNLLRNGGYCGIIVPHGICTDQGTQRLRELLFDKTGITGLFCFANSKKLFDGIDSRFKFDLLTFKKGNVTEVFPAAFDRQDVEELERFPGEGAVDLTTGFIRRFSPDLLAIAEFKSQRDVRVCEKMLRFPLLGKNLADSWSVKFASGISIASLTNAVMTQPGSSTLPLYEGRMIHQFTHTFAPPRFWLDKQSNTHFSRQLEKQQLAGYHGYRLGFRDIASSTNERTLIATVLPQHVLISNTINFTSSPLDADVMLFLTAIFNSFVADFFLRLYISLHVAIHALYQLPVPRLTRQDAAFLSIMKRTAQLICTAQEFKELWETAIFKSWSSEVHATNFAERNRLCAELDGLIAHLYNVTEEEFTYILSTFPLVADPVKVAAQNAYRDVERGLIV